jgi:hypothetical protein
VSNQLDFFTECLNGGTGSNQLTHRRVVHERSIYRIDASPTTPGTLIP